MDDIEQLIAEKERLGLNKIQLVDFIIKKGNNYIKSIIESLNKIGRLKLNIYNITDLIMATKDKEYIKSIIENKGKIQELRLHERQLLELIDALQDKEYIKSILENKDKIEELELGKQGIIYLIVLLEDKEYIKSILEDRNKMKELYFDIYDAIALIQAIDDDDYIKNIVENESKRKELTESHIIDLLKEIKDKTYIYSIIENEDKRRKTGLSFLGIIPLVVYFGDSEYIKKFADSLDKTDLSNSNKIIKLPNNMTIGMEIETEGKNSEFIRHFLIKDWVSEYDGSLTNGKEVKSPKLTGDTRKSSEQIKKICGRLNLLRSNSFR